MPDRSLDRFKARFLRLSDKLDRRRGVRQCSTNWWCEDRQRYMRPRNLAAWALRTLRTMALNTLDQGGTTLIRVNP